MDPINEYLYINFNNDAEESLALYSEGAVNITHSNELISRFLKLLNSQFSICHNVSDYSNQLGIKPKSLLRLLKKEGLKNPSDIIKLKLIFEAKNQLIFTNKSIRDICFDLGFYDPAYFSRFFKKHMSITAQDYRNQYAKILKGAQMEKSTTQ